MKVSTPTRISLALAFALATLAPAQAATVSGYGFDVTYDASQLGTSWTASFGASPTGATLLFRNSSLTSTDYFNTSFSFSITPRSVASAVGSNVYSYPEYSFNYDLNVDQLVGTRTDTQTIYRELTGGAIGSISSLGINTLPTYTSVPSAYGENNLSASVTTSAGFLVSKQSNVTFLDAAAGNSNAVFIQEISSLPTLSSVGPTQTFAAGSQFAHSGVIYEALVDRTQDNRYDDGWNPYGGEYWNILPAPTAVGGVLNETMTVTVSSEIWTPTFLQPGVRQCAGVNCMVAKNGRYVASAFEVSLNSTSRIYDEISTVLTPVPEPETYAMLLAGLGLMGAVARRRKA